VSTTAADTRSRIEPTARTPTKVGTKRRSTGSIIAFIIATILAILWLIPLAWALATSLKPDAETTQIPVTWIGSKITFEA
jgi:multiple sugar transport system permease protein